MQYETGPFMYPTSILLIKRQAPTDMEAYFVDDENKVEHLGQDNTR